MKHRFSVLNQGQRGIPFVGRWLQQDSFPIVRARSPPFEQLLHECEPPPPSVCSWALDWQTGAQLTALVIICTASPGSWSRSTSAFEFGTHEPIKQHTPYCTYQFRKIKHLPTFYNMVSRLSAIIPELKHKSLTVIF